MTTKRKEIYNYIKLFIEENSYPPTIREIAKAVHLVSSSTVHRYLIILEKQGFIWRDKTKPRAIRILK